MNTIESGGRTIDTFASAVRAALSDLPADEVNDLTEGLEADLAEHFDEDPDEPMPDPIAYADELREAAGLVPRTAPVGPVRSTAWERVAALGPNVIRDIRAAPAGSEVPLPHLLGRGDRKYP